MEWSRIPAQIAVKMWPEAAALLDVAMAKGYTGIMSGDLYAALVDDRVQLWSNGRSVALTEILSWPKKKGLRVIALSGDGLGDWVEELDAKFVEFAKAHGCNGIEIVGRDGWVKPLGPLGYEKRHVLIWKEL